MRYLIFIVMLGSFAYSQVPVSEPGVSHELAVWRAAYYSDVRYKLDLNIEKMSPVLKGRMEIRLKLGKPGKGLQISKDKVWISAESGDGLIILDWRKINGSEKLSTLSKVSINGHDADFLDMNTFLIEKPDKPTYTEDSDHLFVWDGIPGENVIKLDFTSPILTSGSAITRYIDKEDGAEYIYSLFVPSDASTAFPVFDQPDLKARFTLGIQMPVSWRAITNGVWSGTTSTDGGEIMPRGISFEDIVQLPVKAKDTVKSPVKANPISQERSYGRVFEETRPISTYVFAFAAGPFSEFDDEGGNPSGSEGAPDSSIAQGKNTLPTGRVSASVAASHVYVRRSQAEKFKPHAAEVFRLTREGVKYLESYFDYKFPFPKYDLVLIPEFPFGGMEHAGATFVRESAIIFPQEPTRNDYISRANLLFHEAAHQWFGDTVTMKWFDDLWLKEGFAEFMAYKTLEKVMPEYNAWKVFYERNKQAAYLTDSTKGTTPIYQPIANLSAAKSAYGNIVYRKAPSFLRQAEFYLGEDKFQTAARAFLKKHEYANAGWKDLVREFESAAQMQNRQLDVWASQWIEQSGVPKMRVGSDEQSTQIALSYTAYDIRQSFYSDSNSFWEQKIRIAIVAPGKREKKHDFVFGGVNVGGNSSGYHTKSFLSVSQDQRAVEDQRRQSIADFEPSQPGSEILLSSKFPEFIFPNYQDYGYGIFLLDDKSRDYVLKNIQNEKDDFLRTMMWGSLWDSVREAELDPREYVELVIRNLVQSDAFTRSNAGKKTPKSVTLNTGETDESTIATLLARVSTAMNYYIPDAKRSEITPRLEELLLDKLQNASTPGQRITYYRTYVSIASTPKSHEVLKQMLAGAGTPAKPSGGKTPAVQSRTKDKFDIVTRLAILGDADAPRLLAELEKTETSDDAKRYAYAARAGFGTAQNKAKYWDDFVNNKSISESWIESAIGPFNSIRHADVTAQYLERALSELPNLKRSRKIFFINNWLAAFIGGQRSEAALAVINKFLDKNPRLDKDLRLKILENSDLIERSVRIRNRFK